MTDRKPGERRRLTPEQLDEIKARLDGRARPRKIKPFRPEQDELHAGFSGIALGCDRFELGRGLVLRSTYAHLIAPFLMAFEPAPPGAPHPAPWAPVSDGMAFDIVAELHVPKAFRPTEWFDRVNTIWWIAAMIRLRAWPLARVCVISSRAYAEIANAEEQTRMLPAELAHTPLIQADGPTQTVKRADLEWLRRYWWTGGVLMRRHANFNTAFQAIDEWVWARSHSIAMVLLWGGLQGLFVSERYNVGRRLAARVSSYLEPSGCERDALRDRIAELWDARSDAAHGTRISDNKAVKDTYDVFRRVLLRMLENDHVPTEEECRSLG